MLSRRSGASLSGWRRKNLEGNGGVGGVVFGTAGSEGTAVLGQGAGMDGKDDEEVVFKQGRHDRALG